MGAGAVTQPTGEGDARSARPGEGAPPRQSHRSSVVVRALQQYGMVIVLALMVLVFSIARPDTFATMDNFQSIVNNQAVLVLAALAVMIPLVVGGFDLSMPATLSLTSSLVIGLQAESGFPWPVAVLVCLAAGGAIGLANGLLVAKMRLNSFVVTLATQTIVVGLTTWYTGGQVMFAKVSETFLDAGKGTLGGFVYPLFLALALVAVAWYWLEHTASGRQMYATGSNQDAARLAGVATSRLTIVAFTLGGALAALAGVVQAAKIGSGQPDIGNGFLLPAFASAFLGATAIRLGRYNALGTLLGVLLVATGFSGLVLLGVALWVQPVFYGSVLLVAIGAPWLAERIRNRAPARAAPAAPESPVASSGSGA